MTIIELKAIIAHCPDTMEVYIRRDEDDYPVSAECTGIQQYGFGGEFKTILVINS